MGLVEIKGAAECERPLRSRLTDAICVHYEWSIEEQWERRERDKDGNNKTTRGWTSVGEGKARERKDVVAAEIASDEHAPLFLISGRSEKDVHRLPSCCARCSGRWAGSRRWSPG